MIKETKNSILVEFDELINHIYGLYLDATIGFSENKNYITNIQNATIKREKVTKEYLDNLVFSFGDEKFIQHRCTQKEFIERNTEGGFNFVALGNLCIVLIYQYWEDHYRQEIAKCLSFEKNELTSELFGELRIIRHSIIHNNAIALKEVNNCKIITWLYEGNPIWFTPEDMKFIINKIKEFLDLLNRSIILKINKNEA